MRRKLIYSLGLLFLLFSLGAGVTIFHIYNVTQDLQSVITLHKVEIIRQNLVINNQTVQSNLYTAGTVFGKELDVIVDNVTALDNSIHSCSSCHHNPDMTQRLKDVENLVEQYKEAISYLITTTANKERIDRLKMVAVGIGDTLLSKTQEMAFIAEKSLNKKTVQALREINNSRIILIATLFVALLISLLIAFSLTRQITKPVYALVEAARMIASGNLGFRTSYDDKTEFGELARNFNTMSDHLKEERERIVRYVDQLSGLYNITLSFYKLSAIEDAFQTICSQVKELLKVQQCVLVLYEEAEQSFVAHTSADALTEQDRRLLRSSRREAEELLQVTKGLPLIANDPAHDERLDPVASRALGEQSVLLVWLQGKELILGALRVSNKEGGFTDEDAKLLSILGGHLSVAIENASLYGFLQAQMAELRETQEQLIQSAKLAAIGELASNVAHEINNPLTSIVGFTEMLKDEEDLGLIRERLEIIEKESLRARDIVRQLLQFARKRPLHLAALDVNEIVRDVIPLIESQIKSCGVELVEEYGVLPETVGDSNQLKQVFLNIINNAVAAMNGGGRLAIRTWSLGEYLYIDFTDNGSGISAEALPRIFEPFFSTKKEKGTGLGLSISYRIIQDHGGRIDVESTPGQGATFSVRLPIRTAP